MGPGRADSVKSRKNNPLVVRSSQRLYILVLMYKIFVKYRKKLKKNYTKKYTKKSAAMLTDN